MSFYIITFSSINTISHWKKKKELLLIEAVHINDAVLKTLLNYIFLINVLKLWLIFAKSLYVFSKMLSHIDMMCNNYIIINIITFPALVCFSCFWLCVAYCISCCCFSPLAPLL